MTLKINNDTDQITEQLAHVKAVFFLAPLPSHIEEELERCAREKSLRPTPLGDGRLLLFQSNEDFLLWQDACEGLLLVAAVSYLQFRVVEPISGFCDSGTSASIRNAGLATCCVPPK